MKYLAASDVLFIHSAVIDETGGTHGIRDMGLLQSALANPRQSFEGRDLYLALIEKAAVLLYGLIKNHPFVDGNKRTSITTLGVFLGLNGVSFEAEQSEVVSFAIAVAGGRLKQEDIASWIRTHSKPFKK